SSNSGKTSRWWSKLSPPREPLVKPASALKQRKRVGALDHHPDETEKQKSRQHTKHRPAPVQRLFAPVITDLPKSAPFQKTHELRVPERRVPSPAAGRHQTKAELWTPEEKPDLSDEETHIGYLV